MQYNILNNDYTIYILYKILKYNMWPLPCLIIVTLYKCHAAVAVAFCMNENWHSSAVDRPNRKIRHLSNFPSRAHILHGVRIYRT